jgi:hypothetical protein
MFFLGKKNMFTFLLVLLLLIAGPQGSFGSNMDALGPLSIHSGNPRYFADANGKIVYLTGSHTWNNFQDIEAEAESSFDYRDFLDFMQENHHNFMRLWVWEQAAWISTVEGKVVFHPLPYQRTGPGRAIDGGSKFDLARFNQDYFDRMRARVQEARSRGIYVAVMMFQGFGIEKKPSASDSDGPVTDFFRKVLSRLGSGSFLDKANNPWRGHPFNSKNNINGVDGDPQRRLDGRSVHTLAIPEITRLQEQYVKKVIDTLSDLDNVLWEIANESHADSTAWQYHMIDFIHGYEKAKATQHPILMTVQWPDGNNAALFRSRAEAVSPNQVGGFRDNSAVADGLKVIIADTDHLWGVGGNWKWVWKSFLMGMNPIFMDPYTVSEFQSHPTKPDWDLLRRNMGYTRAFAEKVNLAEMSPNPELASSGYCLAREGKEYLVYAPEGADVKVNLSRVVGEFGLEWFDPVTGSTVAGGTMSGGTTRSFRTPFGSDGVLHIHERTNP